MTVPGSNILNRALRLIGRQSFNYYAYITRANNDIGLDVATYAPPIVLLGSVQPVNRTMFERYGLDLQKNYYTIYVSKSVLDVARNVSGDVIVYGGRIFNCESITNWFAADGWVAVLAVMMPPNTVMPTVLGTVDGKRITTTAQNPISIAGG